MAHLHHSGVKNETYNRTLNIFIVGDACHTHSPKAGQGMNVSMADSFNLGWKLASVILGKSHPKLLNTYSEERQSKAQELIEFDRDMARLFSAKPTNAAEAKKFQRYFSTHARYTAGVETKYAPSLIIGENTHQALAEGFEIGKRFHSAPVVRLADAKPMQLGHTIKADGRWRLFLFADAEDQGQENGAVAKLCKFLQEASQSPLRRYTPEHSNIDDIFDVRVVFQQSHNELALERCYRFCFQQKGNLVSSTTRKSFVLA